MIGPLAFLLSKNGLIAAGAVTTVTLTGAGGYLSGAGQSGSPAVRVVVPAPVTKIQRVTVVKPVRTVIIRQRPRPRPGPQASPPPPGAPGAPAPGRTAPGPRVTVTATATAAPPPPQPGRC